MTIIAITTSPLLTYLVQFFLLSHSLRISFADNLQQFPLLSFLGLNISPTFSRHLLHSLQLSLQHQRSHDLLLNRQRSHLWDHFYGCSLVWREAAYMLLSLVCWTCLVSVFGTAEVAVQSSAYFEVVLLFLYSLPVEMFLDERLLFRIYLLLQLINLVVHNL